MAIPAVSPRFPARALHYGLHSPTSGFWSSTTSSKCGKPCLQTGLWALLCWVYSKKLGSPGLISHLLGQGPEALTAARAQLLALWLEALGPWHMLPKSLEAAGSQQRAPPPAPPKPKAKATRRSQQHYNNGHQGFQAGAPPLDDLQGKNDQSGILHRKCLWAKCLSVQITK